MLEVLSYDPGDLRRMPKLLKIQRSLPNWNLDVEYLCATEICCDMLAYFFHIERVKNQKKFIVKNRNNISALRILAKF